MQFTVMKDTVLEELQLLQGIVEKRTTMPILQNILVRTSDSRVELVGTDLEVGLRTHFEAEVTEPGGVTVSGKKIFEIVKSLRAGEPVLFRQKDGQQQMVIKSGESEFKVNCIPPDDYPQVSDSKFSAKTVFPHGRFKEMINLVAFAIAQEQRYYLNGALLNVKKDVLELVSTDGHRLSFAATAVDKLKLDKPISVIVAKKTLIELLKSDDDDLDFDADDNNLFFRVKHRTLISRIIESKFPNYEAVIPKENPHVLTVERESLTQAIRRVSLLSAERSRGIKLTLNKEDKGTLELFSSNPEIGEARDKIDVDYKGPNIEVGFNSQYLLDFLAAVSSDRVVFKLKDENSSALLQPDPEGDVKALYVLMPMKI
ncbi:MAG: DNA polymerase III subunit beta [Candidatus Aminicenantes bacterium]|nr:DNA polymerase III subunit beta [Candidatus Aminicenantes bacterium]